MTDMNKINVAALENVAGGYETHTVHNDAVSYANCRKEHNPERHTGLHDRPQGQEGRLCMVRDHAGRRL